MPLATARSTPLRGHAEWSHVHCSFCGKDGNQVRFLAAGIGGKICDACCFKAALIFVKAWLTPRRAHRASSH